MHRVDASEMWLLERVSREPTRQGREASFAALNKRAAGGWKDDRGRLRVTIDGQMVMMEPPAGDSNHEAWCAGWGIHDQAQCKAVLSMW